MTPSVDHVEATVKKWKSRVFSLRRLPWLEVALLLSLVSLNLLIFEQQLVRWWHSPSPGKVGVGYLDDNKDFGFSCLSEAYLVSLPPSYRRRQNWPLIVFLHGSGERGNNPKVLRRYTDMLANCCDNELPAVLLFPQCRSHFRWEASDLSRFVEITGRLYHVDSQRVYLVGHSMGGYGTWRTAAEHPDLIAAIAPIAGGESIDLANRLASIPTWAFHGNKDDVVPAEQTVDLVEAIRFAGGCPKLTLYAEESHGIVNRVFKTQEFWQWLFEQNLQNRQQTAATSSAMAKEP